MAFTKRGGRRRRRKTKRRKLSKQSHRKHLRRSRRGGDPKATAKYMASKIAQGASAVKRSIGSAATAAAGGPVVGVCAAGHTIRENTRGQHQFCGHNANQWSVRHDQGARDVDSERWSG